jgi:phage repressor protein C with HTH and peptisase S24 domain
MDKDLIIKQLVEYYSSGNNSQFAKMLGIKPQTISTWIARKSFDIELIFAKCEGVSPEWLLTGEGKMLKEDRENHFREATKMIPATGVNGIPLIPINAMAGFGSGECQVLEYECDRYVVPLFKEAEFLITVKGSSMIPKYNSGDIVACKKLALDDLFFQWNKVYVLDTAQGALIKRVKEDKDHEGSVLIVSDNPAYPPFSLCANQIHSIAIVVGVIRLE